MLDTANNVRQARRRAATRLEILEAAWAIAREHGIASITLRDVAERVGMRAPSIYAHFESKHAIHDAMFGQAWTECLAAMQAARDQLLAEQATGPVAPREVLRRCGRTFFDFAVTDLPRHQLMNQRTLPGFEPTPQAYAPAVATLELFRAVLAGIGVTRDEDVDLATAMIGGLVEAQLANDPGGDRWGRLVDRAMDMFAAELGLAPTDESNAESTLSRR